MPELNKDVLLLIFEELQYDRKSLHSCLLVKRSWCEVIIPILWRDHTKDLKKIKKSLNIIISHLSNETKEKLKSQGIDISTTQKKPLFNYIGFCRYLDLYGLKKRISSMANIEKSQIPILSNEILKLFINRNTSITHLLIPKQCDYQIHLIPGAETCFSELKFLQCRTNTGQEVLEGLAKICKSVKKLELDLAKSNNNRGVSKLIEAQTNLIDVRLTCLLQSHDVSFCKSLEESLIRHADSVQTLRIDWRPTTKILLCFVNLMSLEISASYFNINNSNYSYITNASLPLLKILKVRYVQSEHLTSLIKSTKGHLTEINILHDGYDNGMLIQAIYQNCPNLIYLQLSFYENNISSELENLLINCQNLNGLVTITDNWENIFKILTKSSPIGLYKFKFCLYSLSRVKSEPLEIFFNDWEGRPPISLQIVQSVCSGYFDIDRRCLDLIEQYKAKGIVEEYEMCRVNWMNRTFDNFEWVQKNVGSI